MNKVWRAAKLYLYFYETKGLWDQTKLHLLCAGCAVRPRKIGNRK